MSKKIIPSYADPLGVIMTGFPGIGNAIIAEGATVPANATAGYAPGCLFFKRAGVSNAVLYVNVGTIASCTFVPLSTGGLDLSGLLATAAEINRTCQNSSRPVLAGAAALTVTQALHDGKTILLDQATGTAVTLPVMSGSGAIYTFFCSVATSGGSQVLTATAAHLFGSIAIGDDTGVGTLFTNRLANSAGGSTTITLDGTTKGGRKGDWLQIHDVAAGIGWVSGQLNASGTEATPYA